MLQEQSKLPHKENPLQKSFQLKCFKKVNKVPRRVLFNMYTRPLTKSNGSRGKQAFEPFTNVKTFEKDDIQPRSFVPQKTASKTMNKRKITSENDQMTAVENVLAHREWKSDNLNSAQQFNINNTSQEAPDLPFQNSFENKMTITQTTVLLPEQIKQILQQRLIKEERKSESPVRVSNPFKKKLLHKS
ncbi:hypothetical protein RFI_01547 [Reticulomyxa filosa]|uniref:Uncharacterized protein n=1 Tax=Reticulomyxa filosa TaxID=46433 RepID=X6PBM3_RETFI|nr:hypothetical protein RFI_01547 [Reticulomyxa filosa]|eukprot:ETO35518.1 hypothetical protein RFI_01547 [Reticulomyxa filosa]